MLEFDFQSIIALKSDRVIIRPLEAADIANLQEIAFQDETLLDYSPSSIHTQAALENYILTALSAKTNGQRYPFIIFDKETNQYAGSTSFGNISNRDRRLEIGWTWIGRQYQGTGLNKACKFLLLHYAFETLQFERVEFKIDSRNTRSRKAVEKIGGKIGGRIEKSYLNVGWFPQKYSILWHSKRRMERTKSNHI